MKRIAERAYGTYIFAAAVLASEHLLWVRPGKREGIAYQQLSREWRGRCPMARRAASPGVSGDAQRRHHRCAARLPLELDGRLLPNEARWQKQARLHRYRGFSRKAASADAQRSDNSPARACCRI